MSKIYRFRTFGKSYSLDDLKYNTITGITNDKMNDPYDCHFYFDIQKVCDYIDDKNLLNVLKTCTVKSKIKKYKINQMVEYIGNHLQGIIVLLFYTICFTNEISKEIMWAHYSKNGRGFAIEYDKEEILEQLEKIKKIDEFRGADFRRINYINEKKDYTNFVMNYIDSLIKSRNCSSLKNSFFLDIYDLPIFKPDENMPQVAIAKEIAFQKSKDWSYEDEYRIITTNNAKNTKGGLLSNHIIVLKNIEAKAIYVGEKCSIKNQREILSIAKLKNIKVYKMKRNYNDKKFCLVYEEVMF